MAEQPTPLTAADLDRLQALCDAEAAGGTGPWKLIWWGNEQYPFPFSVHSEDDGFWLFRDGHASSTAAARLAVEARNALPALIATVRTLREEIESLLADRDRLAGIVERLARVFGEIADVMARADTDIAVGTIDPTSRDHDQRKDMRGEGSE